ncbi:MAG TPA: ATP-binding protein [Polyangiaceae bacterium]|nr:ATP-binding protein [Polyangiaceae bacterium]
MKSNTSKPRAPSKELERRLTEAESTLEAIQSGTVDAVVVHGPQGPQVYSLEGPDQPFRTFVEGMQEGALTLSGDGTVLYANRFLAELLGKDAEQVMGRDFAAFVAEEYKFTFAELRDTALKRGTKGNLRLIGASNTIPVQLTLSPLNGTGSPACCGVVFDLREREQMEHANAAREAAEKASEARDRFLAVLSHELRSPLGTILGWAQVLGMRADFDEKTRHALQSIERNARAQAKLIEELLDVSRFMAGKLHLETEVIDFAQIVQSAVTSARLGLDKSVELASHSGEVDAYVLGDPTRLQQVVTNLLNNAIKFTDPGGHVQVDVTTEAGQVVLRVSDTGIGISPEQIPRLFGLFQQVELNSRKSNEPYSQRRKTGLGLGLAVSKQLVEAHGGKIVGHSEGIGHGATFEVRLPRVAAPPAIPLREEGQRGRLAGIRVLLVEDELDLLDLTRHVLEVDGASVSAAQSAAAALALLRTETFDVLLTDIGLPEQDGFALIREVRARGHHREQLPAVALTGFASNEHARLAKAAGFQMHLAKPVDSRELVQAVQSLTAPPRADD